MCRRKNGECPNSLVLPSTLAETVPFSAQGISALRRVTGVDTRFEGQKVQGWDVGSSLPSCSPGWTGFVITCFPCIAMTLQKNSTKLSRSCCQMWETPK